MSDTPEPEAAVSELTWSYGHQFHGLAALFPISHNRALPRWAARLCTALAFAGRSEHDVPWDEIQLRHVVAEARRGRECRTEAQRAHDKWLKRALRTIGRHATPEERVALARVLELQYPAELTRANWVLYRASAHDVARHLVARCETRARPKPAVP